MDAIKQFFIGFWEYCRWYLVGIGVAYLILLIPFRQPGKAMGLLLLGLYVTLTAYFLSIYREMGFELEAALGVVILFGLALAALLYYAFFIRAD